MITNYRKVSEGLIIYDFCNLPLYQEYVILANSAAPDETPHFAASKMWCLFWVYAVCIGSLFNAFSLFHKCVLRILGLLECISIVYCRSKSRKKSPHDRKLLTWTLSNNPSRKQTINHSADKKHDCKLCIHRSGCSCMICMLYIKTCNQ